MEKIVVHWNKTIEIVSIKVAAETKILHIIIECDFYLREYEDLPCSANVWFNSQLSDMAVTEHLIMSYGTIKYKAAFLTAYLKHKFRDRLFTGDEGWQEYKVFRISTNLKSRRTDGN